MSLEEQSAAYNQVQSAYDAYDALTDGQKALVGDAEKISRLFTYFNSLAAPTAERGSGTCGDSGSNLTWVLSDDGTLTISGSGKMKDYDQGYAPWYVWSGDITSVVINAGVTSIGGYAFYYCHVTSVTIPAGVTSIGQGAFYECGSLGAITFPDSVTSIGDHVFVGCDNLTSITIPAGVTSIGKYVFTSSGLKEITFTGDAPTFGKDPFTRITATAYYPANNSTWTSDVMQNYGGTITWKKVCMHVWGEWSTTVERTCTEKGKQTRICSICEEKETSELDALGHSYGDPTWTWNDDYSAAATFTCARDESHVQTVTAEVTDEVTTAATCGTEGERTYTATVTFDNKTHTDTSKETISALGHDWEITKMLRRPSCTRDGKAIYTCTRCSEKKKDVVEAPGHDWDEGRVIKTPTCTRRGKTVYTCRSCRKTRTEYQDAYGHAWDDGVVVKEPTCTKNGTVIYTCDTCGKTASERIPALGHNYENGVCTNCGGKKPSKPSRRPGWWPSWWK